MTTSNTSCLIVDDREQLFKKTDKTSFGNIISKRLPIGDYLWCITEDNIINMIVERKSWKDLAQSYCNKRLFKQLN